MLSSANTPLKERGIVVLAAVREIGRRGAPPSEVYALPEATVVLGRSISDRHAVWSAYEAGYYEFAVEAYPPPQWRPGIDMGRVERLVAARSAARAEKRWADADAIRAELRAMGVEVEDLRDGRTLWHRP